MPACVLHSIRLLSTVARLNVPVPTQNQGPIPCPHKKFRYINIVPRIPAHAEATPRKSGAVQSKPGSETCFSISQVLSVSNGIDATFFSGA